MNSRPIPPKPAAFTATGAPAGVEIKFVTFTAQRPVMRHAPRLQLVHTNAAAGEGSIESAWNWAHARPGANTLPHYQIDRQIGKSGYIARKMLPTNRVGIANATVDSYQDGHGDVRDWSLAYETADLGYGAGKPGDESGFSPPQAEMLATILAYETVTHGIPLAEPTEWYGPGTAGHTDPFTYPYWTMYRGKTCPGRLKLEQLWTEVMPRALQIATAWMGGDGEPPEEDDEMTPAQEQMIRDEFAALNRRIDSVWDVINQTNAQVPATGDGKTVVSRLEDLKWLPSEVAAIRQELG